MSGGGYVDPRVVERLRHAEDIAARLNTQLQQVAGMTHNDLAKFRNRMLNPDIAIPLLQCYDATIEEKSNEIEALKAELRKAQSRSESIGADRVDLENQLKVSNMQISEMLQNERRTAEDSTRSILAMQSEIALLRQQLAEMHESRSSLQSRVEKEAVHTKELLDKLAEQGKKLEDAESALASAKKQLQNAKLQDDDGQSLLETQRIQLALISKENDDKVHEIERLRNKMGQMLKQSEDNHLSHLRIVEEKHKHVVESLREEVRAQEMTVLKLRAQLSRADIMPGANGGNGVVSLAGAHRPTTADVLDSQSRQAQDFEIKRLASELTSAQLMRDDALFRLDQLNLTRRQDADDRFAEAKRDLEVARSRAKECDERAERLQRELNSASESLRTARDKLKFSQAETAKVAHERETLQKKYDELKKTVSDKEEQLQVAVQDKADAVESATRASSQLERRLEESRREMQSLREKFSINLNDAERAKETLTRENRELFQSLQVAQGALRDKDREVETANSKIGWLLKGLTQHKQQITECDQRLQSYAAQEAQSRGELKEAVVQLTHCKMELARCMRDRDRLAADVHRRH